MKVLHVLYRIMPSGAEMMLNVAAEQFHAVGIEGCVCVNDNEDGDFAPVLRAAGYRIFRIPWRNSRSHLIDFWKLCRLEKFDVLHIHVIRGYLGFAIAARLAGVRTIVKTFHGLFSPADRLRWMWHIYQRWACIAIGVKMHAISRSVQRNEKLRYKTPTRLIWNWIDEDKFPLADERRGYEVRKRLGIPSGKFVILSVGNCHSHAHMTIKNHGLILRAMSQLDNEKLDNIVYLHVGKESDGLPEREHAKELCIDKSVRFLGPRKDVYDLLCAANLFVMSSLHEGLGNSVIEALVSGRRVILSQVGGLIDFGEIIPELRYFTLNPASLAGLLREELDRSEGLQGDASIRDRALAAFSSSVGIRGIIELYGRVVV